MLTELQEQRIVRAIANAERDNRAEVRVHLERRCPPAGPLVRAKTIYQDLRLHETQDDTGVLLYVAAGSKKAAVYSGQGVYARSSPEFWQEVVDALAAGYKNGNPADAICGALGQLGDLLRETVPGDDSHGNEVPNEVTVGPEVAK